MGQQLLRVLHTALQVAAEPAKAAPMQAYMKSAMPYLGVQTPQLRAVCKMVFAQHPLSSATLWQQAILDLWRRATSTQGDRLGPA